MPNPHITYSFNITPIFNYIQEQAGFARLYIHYEEDAKASLQLFLNKQEFELGQKYIGAIQYEGSRDFTKREPHLVSWRFKRDNLLLPSLKEELEQITSFRQDTNQGPSIDPTSESIAYKFKHLGEEEKETMGMIVKVLQKYS